MRRIRITAPSIFALFAATAFCAASMAGEEPSADASAGDEQAKEAATEKPDPFKVPDGSPEELLAYIEGLQGEGPEARTFQAVREFQRKRAAAVLTAVDRIVAAEPDEEQLQQALVAKLTTLSSLVRFDGSDENLAKLEAMPEEFEKAGLERLAREARRSVLGVKATTLRTAGPEETKELLNAIGSFVEQGDKSLDDFRLAMEAASNVERSGKPDVAAKAYKRFAKLFADAKDERVAEYAPMMEGAARRIQLLGSEMPLEGVTLDGERLDWKDYEGKVVLVDFWATWCPPCLAEIPNIEKNYEAYHDRGFDVVSISVDRDREALEEFLEEHDHPWIVLWDPAAKEAEDLKSMATHYGVLGIPMLALIGRDGKVVAMNPRGEQLGEELAKLLGPPAEEKPKEEENEGS